jgi:hypothetical protein
VRFCVLGQPTRIASRIDDARRTAFTGMCISGALGVDKGTVPPDSMLEYLTLVLAPTAANWRN